MFAIGVTMALAEGIIDDSFFLLFFTATHSYFTHIFHNSLTLLNFLSKLYSLYIHFFKECKK